MSLVVLLALIGFVAAGPRSRRRTASALPGRERDVSRRRVGFAWQALERFPDTDLHRWLACGPLDRPLVAQEIGRVVATWQGITPDGFGVLDLNLRG
jgi:hypothetical protein